MTTWYIAQLKPNATHRAKPRRNVTIDADTTRVEQALEEAGFLHYMPRMRRELQHHRTKKIFTRRFPLMAGYVFVAAARGEPNWYQLRSCDGVGRLLGCDGRPWPVDPIRVDTMRQAEEEGVFDDTQEARVRRQEEGRNRRETTALQFPPGALVTITEGPFVSLQGIVASVTRQGLVRVILHVFGQETPTDLPVEWVERRGA